MKYHIATVALLLAAIAFYSLGMRSGGVVAFLLGAAFELWFWVRVVGGRRETRDAPPKQGVATGG